MPPGRRILIATLSCLAIATGASGATRRAATLADLTTSAGRVFRGTCEKVEVGDVEIAGARLPMTVYTFRVSDVLKGSAGARLTFRQIGLPGGGQADLGRQAGLPVYSPGADYVLFLLPESRAGLTSPAGAAQGAFEVVADRILPLGALPVEPGVRSYRELRARVRGTAAP